MHGSNNLRENALLGSNKVLINNDQVKAVAGLRHECYELFSCTGDASDVIHQSQISIRRQGSGSKSLPEHLQE